MARLDDTGGGGPFDYYKVSGTAIRAAAEDTRRRLSAIATVKSQLAGQARAAVAAVEGQLQSSMANAPTMVNAIADDVVQKATYAAGALEVFAIYVDDFDYGSANPRSVSKLNAAYSEQAAANFGTAAVTYPDNATTAEETLADTQWSRDYTRNRNAVLGQLTTEYHQLEGELDMSAQHVSEMLGRGPNAADLQQMYGAGALPSFAALIFPQVNFSGVKLTELPYDLRGLPPDELAALLLSSPEVPLNVVNAALKDPVIATEIGRLLGEEARQLDGSFDRETLTAWTEKYERFAGNATVNAGMLTALGAAGTLDLLCSISYTDAGAVPPDDAQRHILSLLKEGLQRATTYLGFDGEQFAHDLVSAGTSDVAFGEGSTYQFGYTGALSYLLYNGHYGDEFIGTVAADLDSYERIDNAGTLDLWADRHSVASGSYNWYDLMPAGAGETADQDPMISLMSALAKSPQADLDFFSAGGDSDGNGIPDRQEYYIKQRIWDGDGFYAISKALDTASTDPSVLQGPEATNAATLASATVNLFAQREYLDDNIEKMAGSGDGTDDAGRHFAHILSTYMVGVDYADRESLVMTGPPGPSRLWFPELHSEVGNVPLFSADAVKDFSLVAMSTDGGLAELRAGLNAYEGLKLGAAADYLQNHPDDEAAREALTQSVYRNADLEGMFMNELGDSKIAEARGRDDAIESWVHLGQDVVEAVPIPGSKALGEGGEAVLNLAVSTGSDGGADALMEQWAHFEQDEVAKQNTDATSMLHQQEYAVAKTLFEHGMATDPQAIVDSGSTTVTKDSQGSYHLMPYDEFSELSDADRLEALSHIISADHGVGMVFDQGQYENQYEAQFHDLFEGG